MRQLALDLEARPALGREDFLVAPCNAEAVAWIDSWPDWPAPLLALWGPAGSGKTHLAQVWRANSGALALDASDLHHGALRERLAGAHCCLVDDAERLAGSPPGERALFDLYNLVSERGGQLLLTGRHPPVAWAVALADLRSRLATAVPVELGSPDDELMRALLIKLFSDRQILPGRGVIDYLVVRIERSHAAAVAIVDALDRQSLERRRELRLPLVRELLGTHEAIAGSDGQT